MLLNISQFTAQTPQQRTSQSKMSRVPRLRNSALEDKVYWCQGSAQIGPNLHYFCQNTSGKWKRKKEWVREVVAPGVKTEGFPAPVPRLGEFCMWLMGFRVNEGAQGPAEETQRLWSMGECKLECPARAHDSATARGWMSSLWVGAWQSSRPECSLHL